MRVAVYVRVSTEDQNPQNQLLVCEKYCNENEYEIVDTYIDKKSGRSKKSRNNEKRRFASVSTGEKIMLPSGFEPESKPREGFMIGRYTTGARFFFFIHQKPLEEYLTPVHPLRYHPQVSGETLGPQSLHQNEDEVFSEAFALYLLFESRQLLSHPVVPG
jgi:hypothetical protein